MDDGFDVVPARAPEGLGFFVKARANGRLFRVSPARDPRQPRFWCVLVSRCTQAGVGEPGERPWLGAGGMTREELPAALEVMRADVGGWLAQEQCRDLRDWLLAAAPAPPVPVGRQPAAGGRAAAVDAVAVLAGEAELSPPPHLQPLGQDAT